MTSCLSRMNPIRDCLRADFQQAADCADTHTLLIHINGPATSFPWVTVPPWLGCVDATTNLAQVPLAA